MYFCDIFSLLLDLIPLTLLINFIAAWRAIKNNPNNWMKPKMKSS